MANYEFNVAKGRTVQLFKNVEDNSPSGCEIVIVAVVNNGSTADSVAKDYDTLAALLGDSNIAEATNSSYSRIDLTASDITLSIDDSGDTYDIDISDPSFSGPPAAGDNWTDLVFCYDPTGSSADSALIPLMNFDFAVTPDGNTINVLVDASGLASAT